MGGLSALHRHADLRVLMFHGPLVYQVHRYAGHAPFTERDVDQFLAHYTAGAEVAANLKEDFLREARTRVYPSMVPHSADDWSARRLFEPVAFMAFLLRRIVAEARARTPAPVVAGVVERGGATDFARTVLLARIFERLREAGKADWFNELFGRSDLTSPDAVLRKLNYSDGLLLTMILKPGQRAEPWTMNKFGGFRERVEVVTHDEARPDLVDFTGLAPGGPFGFPGVTGCYVQATDTSDPLRVETFTGLGEGQSEEAAERAYLYAKLLPGYAFPVGLDIADKFAHIPAWMTDAYGKLIRHHLGVAVQRGDVGDGEMRKLLLQSIHMRHRDWLFRPDA